ncbi:MAG: hypothetical protein CO143_03320 [Candidatus Moranbacteria bacterium CG_4_9_14_3_um_filter_45_14]|nr:MAG: hypothetical protein CO143_03320 [Candidatus Moranbacteria bacterium CG_4_9_14_3_um_filter_45_14]
MLIIYIFSMQFLFTKNFSETVTRVHLVDTEADEMIREGGVKILSFGIGVREKMTRRKLMLLVRRVVMSAKEHQVKECALYWEEWQFPHLMIDESEMAEIFATNALMADFSFDIFKTKPKDGFRKVEKIFFESAIQS